MSRRYASAMETCALVVATGCSIILVLLVMIYG